MPVDEPTPQDLADMYLAEYLSEARGDLMSPSGRRPVTYIVYQTGDHFDFYCVFDHNDSSASNHHERLFRCVHFCVCVGIKSVACYLVFNVQ